VAEDPSFINCVLIEHETALHSTSTLDFLSFVANAKALLSISNDICNLFYFSFNTL